MLVPGWPSRETVSLQLSAADAIADPDATNEDVDAAQQRAVELVSEIRQDWTLELRENVADAWFTMWSNADEA